MVLFTKVWFKCDLCCPERCGITIYVTPCGQRSSVEEVLIWRSLHVCMTSTLTSHLLSLLKTFLHIQSQQVSSWVALVCPKPLGDPKYPNTYNSEHNTMHLTSSPLVIPGSSTSWFRVACKRLETWLGPQKDVGGSKCPVLSWHYLYFSACRGLLWCPPSRLHGQQLTSLICPVRLSWPLSFLHFRVVSLCSGQTFKP